MYKLIATVEEELRFIVKTPALLLLLFIAPLAYPFLYSFLYSNKYQTGVPIAVIDLDRSSYSRSFIRALDATEALSVADILNDPLYQQQMIALEEVQGSIIIPEGFAADLISKSHPIIRVYSNATRFMPVSDIGKGISDAIGSISHDILVQGFAAKGVTRENGNRYAEPLNLEIHSPGNTTVSYGDFIIPAILLLILQQTLFTGCAITTAGEKKRPNRDARSGAAPMVRLIGKGLPYFFLYSVYTALFFTVHYHLWDIPFNGTVFNLSLLVSIHLLVMITLGFLTGTFFTSPLPVMILGLFSTYPVFLLSGIPWPPAAMPRLFQILSLMLPSTHFIPAAFAAARLGAGLADLYHWLAVLAAMFLFSGMALYLRMVPRKSVVSSGIN